MSSRRCPPVRISTQIPWPMSSPVPPGAAGDNRVGALYDRIPEIVRRRGVAARIRNSAWTASPACRPRRLDSRPTWDAVRCLCERSMAGPMRCQCWPTSPANGKAKTTSPTHISSPFVEIYDRWTPEPDVTLPVPIGLASHPESTSGEAQAGYIAHPKSAVWATALNHHYRMLLAWLQLSMRSPNPARDPPPLHCALGFSTRCSSCPISASFSACCPAATTATTPGRCSVRTPYSLAVPDQQTDRWTFTPTTWPRANR